MATLDAEEIAMFRAIATRQFRIYARDVDGNVLTEFVAPVPERVTDQMAEFLLGPLTTNVRVHDVVFDAPAERLRTVATLPAWMPAIGDGIMGRFFVGRSGSQVCSSAYERY